MRYFVVHFWSKIMFFVRATAVKQILFLNHRYRKVVGDKHNVLVHYVDVSAPIPSSIVWNIVICNPSRWDILCIFLTQNHVVFCVPATKAKWILFLNHRYGKVVEGKHIVCSSTLCEYLCIWHSWCCPLQPFQMRYFVVHFWSKILLFLCACHNSVINFIPQA